MKNIAIFLLIVFPFYVSAQNQKGKSNDFAIDFGLEFKQLYQYPLMGMQKQVDPAVNYYRPKDTMDYFSPFSHSAVYINPTLSIIYKDIFSFKFQPFFEHRGWSNGVYMNVMQKVFAFFQLSICDTLKMRNNFSVFSFTMGNLYNQHEENYGLKAYNIDMQGVDFKFAYKKYDLHLLYITDLSVSYGLLMGEYFRLKLGRKINSSPTKNPSKIALTFDVNQVILDSTRYATSLRYSSGIQTMVPVSKSLSFYLIADYLLNSPNKSRSLSNVGLLFKMKFKKEIKKGLNLTLSPNLRFFGSNYISENYENGNYGYPFRYRYTNLPLISYTDLYPLKNYFRPVSQYAFFSEYRYANDIYSLELEAKLDFKISSKIRNEFYLESFVINRDFLGENAFYPYVFYTNFTYYEFFKGMDFGVYISNKQYNQEVQYHGFYQMKYPFFGVHFRYKADFNIK